VHGEIFLRRNQPRAADSRSRGTSDGALEMVLNLLEAGYLRPTEMLENSSNRGLREQLKC